MILIYAMQAMLGYGNDERVKPFQTTSYCGRDKEGFETQ